MSDSTRAGHRPAADPAQADAQANAQYADRPDGGEAEIRRAAAEEDTVVIPVVEERLDVHKEPVSTRVQVHKTVQEREQVVEEPVLQEDVTVERVPVGRPVDGPVPVRYEGETMIVPLLEEVLVVEKRLVLREELHITRRLSEVRATRHETLRKEEATVERLPGGASE